MSKTSDELIEEALLSIREDRHRLTDLYDQVKSIADVISMNSSGVEVDALTMKAISEDLVKIADSLTKQTGQVVDLAKLRQKVESLAQVDPNTGLTAADLSGMYDDIEHSN